MDSDRFAFNRGAIRPMVCLSEGWQLIKQDYWLFLGIAFVGALIAGLGPFGILQGPMMCGIHLCLLRREHGMRVSFDMLFKGFDYFLQSFIATMFVVVPMIVLVVFFYIVLFVMMFGMMAQAQGQAAREEALVIFLIVVYGILVPGIIFVGLVLSALFFFIYPLIVDRELTGVEAVKLSIRAAFGNIFGLTALIILTVFLSMLSVLACYIGVFFFMPLSYAMAAVAYRQVFPAAHSMAFSRSYDDDDEPLDEDRPRARSNSTAIESDDGPRPSNSSGFESRE